MNTATQKQYDFSEGEQVRVKQELGEVMLIVLTDETVPVGCVRIAAAHVSTAALGDMFGAITVERA
jgi:NADH-quinone oxidoreductase subunit G